MSTQAARQSRAFRKGEVLMREGEDSLFFLLLEKGILDIYLRGSKINSIDASKAQDFIGEIGVILGTPRTTTVIAATDCVGLVLPRLELENIVKTSPSIAVKLIISLCKKVVNCTTTIPELEMAEHPILNTGSTETSLKNYMGGLLHLMEQATDDASGTAVKALLDYFIDTNPWCIQQGTPETVLSSEALEK